MTQQNAIKIFEEKKFAPCRIKKKKSGIFFIVDIIGALTDSFKP